MMSMKAIDGVLLTKGLRNSAGACLMAAWTFAACASAAAQALPPAPPETSIPIASLPIAGPRIKFDSTSHDFGKVRAGENVKHEFVFTNTGDGVLEIKEVRPSCGCTTTGDWSKKVEPGQTGKIPIEYHSKSDRGTITKSVTVVGNATDQPTTSLKIRAEVWRPIEVEPNTALMRVVNGTPTNAVSTVRIVNRTDKPLSLSELQSNHKSVVGELKELKPGAEFELTVTVAPPFGPSHIYAKITLKTSSEELPLLEVPVYAFVQPTIQITPTVLSLPNVAPTNKVQRTVSFRSNLSTPLVLSEPSLDVPGVEMELREVQAGRYYTLLLTFPQGFEIPAGQNVEVKVKSNYSDAPLIRVPLMKPVMATPPRVARPVTSPPPQPPPPPSLLSTPAARGTS
jgi:hypothetical protein